MLVYFQNFPKDPRIQEKELDFRLDSLTAYRHTGPLQKECTIKQKGLRFIYIYVVI